MPFICFATSVQNDPSPRFVGELGPLWRFPSDHLPIGAKIDNWRIASWNVLNTLFINFIESNTQGLADSLIVTANHPIKEGFPLTLREELTVKIILKMVNNCFFPRSVIGLQEVGDAVLDKLRRKLPSYMTLLTDFNGLLLNGNGEVIIYDSRRFQQLNLAVYHYQGRSNTIMDLALFDRCSEKIYHIINTHTPGGPDGPAALHELSLYVINTFQPNALYLFMGDINQQAPAIDNALAAAALGLNKMNPYRHVAVPYLTHINTHQEAVAIDHFYIAGHVKARGDSPDKVFFGLKYFAELLDDPSQGRK